MVKKVLGISLLLSLFNNLTNSMFKLGKKEPNEPSVITRGQARALDMSA